MQWRRAWLPWGSWSSNSIGARALRMCLGLRLPCAAPLAFLTHSLCARVRLLVCRLVVVRHLYVRAGGDHGSGDLRSGHAHDGGLVYAAGRVGTLRPQEQGRRGELDASGVHQRLVLSRSARDHAHGHAARRHWVGGGEHEASRQCATLSPSKSASARETRRHAKQNVISRRHPSILFPSQRRFPRIVACVEARACRGAATRQIKEGQPNASRHEVADAP